MTEPARTAPDRVPVRPPGARSARPGQPPRAAGPRSIRSVAHAPGHDPGAAVLNVALVDSTDVVAGGLRALLAGYAGRAEVVAPLLLRPALVDLVLVDVCAASASGGRTMARTGAIVGELLERGHTSVFTFGPDLTFSGRATLRAAGARGHVAMSLPAPRMVAALEAAVGLAPSTRPRDDHQLSSPSGTGSPPEPWRNDALRKVGCSPREAEILSLICSGLGNQQIADELFLSINTVKTYIRTAYRRIGLSSRSQVVIWGLRHGL